jgi:hypothetical protein
VLGAGLEAPQPKTATSEETNNARQRLMNAKTIDPPSFLQVIRSWVARVTSE